MKAARTPPLRIGAVGCGPMATGIHLPGIRRLPDLKLVALCDIDAQRLGAAAGQFEVADTYSDYEQMLDRSDLDGVCVVGPPDLHVACARACLERQIPFLTEKPLAVTVEAARELAGLARRCGDCGQVGYTSRYSPAQRLAWRISRSPEFGPISDVNTRHLTQCAMTHAFGKADLVEGLIHLHGVHAIDLWRFFGGDPVQVCASVSALEPAADGRSATGSVLVYARTAAGPHGTIHMKAGAAHNGDVSSDVVGHRTRVRVDDGQKLTYETSQDWMKQYMAQDPLAGAFVNDQPVGRFVDTGLSGYTYTDFFRFEWLAFGRALLEGRPLSPSIAEGCKTVFLTEAICRSLREGGAPVSVEYGEL